ncbi:unnamed protein product [Paramecium primaurelia]|uniref:Trafficking protein particle complex subunit n=2 Tax=Paramecium TaxID=5884 RepID=A0A8S1T804_9CILI|nr:unnamed protein product [Paramecium primaurelia]CAD8147214.1 unnamed protein product [Paramecium pentaurelia]
MKKDRQNYYFVVVNKTGGLQFFSQLKEQYREDQDKITTNQVLQASSIFYAIDHLTQTIIPDAIYKVEQDKDKDFERDNTIDLLITENYMVSTLKTLTGLRFLVISNKNLEVPKKHEDNIQKMRQIYRLYTDYFSKDPFQSDDQPLGEKKRAQFDRDVRELLDF